MRNGLIVLSILLSGCSMNVPGLTSHTDKQLSIKNITIGDGISCNSDPKEIFGNVRLCHIDIKSYGGEKVVSNTIALLNGKVAVIKLALSQDSGFNQKGVLNAMSEKYGPPARGGAPRTHIWTNNKNTMYLDEIKGTVVLYGDNLMEVKKMISSVDAKDL